MSVSGRVCAWAHGGWRARRPTPFPAGGSGDARQVTGETDAAAERTRAPPSVKSLSRLFFWIIRLFKPTTEPKPTATFNLNGESSYLFCMLFCGLYLTVSLFSSSIFGSFWFIFLVFHSLLIITS